MKIIFSLLLTSILAVQQLPAQPSDDNHGSAVRASDASYAPLLLYTNGAGRIIPFEDGQMLQVGRRYFMIAIPDRGCVFANWTPVSVFTTTAIVTNNGVPTVLTNTITSTGPAYTRCPALIFTMQPVEVIEENSLLTISVSEGWQANFVPARKWFQK
jgi:hypothetical protein